MNTEANFWQKYQAVRVRRLPVDSEIYDSIEGYYALGRKEFEVRWGSRFDRRLPDSSVDWYNSLFSGAHRAVRKLFKGQRIPPSAVQRADEFYGLRLPYGITLRELLAYDIFGNITVNQDIRPEVILKGIPDPSKVSYNVTSDTHHFFFHRPQQTEFIFLHEIIVGGLLNLMENGGRCPSRAAMSLSERDYSLASGYTLNVLAKYLRLTVPQTVALHLQTSREVARALPVFAQDLMLISSHVYWYMDAFSKISGAHSPADLLRFVYLAFIVPALERAMEEGDLKMRPGASRFVERRLMETLLSPRKGGPSNRNDSDVFYVLFTLAEELWRPSVSAKKSKRPLKG